jgi:hypothetical protein
MDEHVAINPEGNELTACLIRVAGLQLATQPGVIAVNLEHATP